MAGGGGGDDEENPVPVNCVALIDIIFCLCLFFMCSLHFKQLEGKIESWLPKDKGMNAAPAQTVVLEEMRVSLKWSDETRSVEMRYGTTVLDGTDDQREKQLGDLLKQSHDEYVNVGKPDTPVIIDAEPRVPWKAVVNVMNVCKRADLDKIEFSAPMQKASGS